MTTLKDIFEYLAYGELQQTAVGLLLAQELGPQSDLIDLDDAEYIERARNMEKVVGHVNLALKALYTRFWLSSKDVIVQQYDHIQQYFLDSKYAQPNYLSDEKTRYNLAVLLANNLEQYPENRPVLQELLRTEKSKRIRQHAADSLY